MKKLILLLAFLPFLVNARIASENVITIYTSKPYFTIKVNSNPNRNLSWFIKSVNEKLFKKTGKRVSRSRSKLLSTPGEKTFQFELRKKQHYPSSSEIFLFYAKHKNSQKGILKKYKIKIIDDRNR